MALVDKKLVGQVFENDSELVKVTYDFASDGGATGDYDVLEAQGPVMVECLALHVETEVDSSGDGTVLDLGKGDGGTGFFSDLAEGNLGAEAINAPTAENRFVELTSGEKVVLGIEGEAATQGKLHMLFRVYKKLF